MTRAARFFRRWGHGERLRASRQRRVALSVALAITTVAGCLTGAGTTGAPQPRASQPGASLSAAAAPAPSPRPAGFTLAITGDLLIHEPIVDKARQWANGAGYDFRPAFAAVKPILSAADLAICHLETPLSRDDNDISYYPTFNVPHEIAPAAADAGFRSCTTASNHTIDKELAGVQATLNALDRPAAAGVSGHRPGGGQPRPRRPAGGADRPEVRRVRRRQLPGPARALLRHAADPGRDDRPGHGRGTEGDAGRQPAGVHTDLRRPSDGHDSARCPHPVGPTPLAGPAQRPRAVLAAHHGHRRQAGGRSRRRCPDRAAVRRGAA